MEWHELFNNNTQPTYENIEEYIGGEALALWQDLFAYMDKSYKAKPKMTYSVCSGKPGWNVKFQKSGQSFGTFYPEPNSFSVFLVISYKLGDAVEAIRQELSPAMQEMYDNAQDFMKNGKFMMYQINTKQDLDDYKKLMTVKMMPKAA